LAEHGKPIVCDECGYRFFRDVVYVFKVSKIMTGTSEDSYVPIKTLACDKCGHVNTEFDMQEKEPEKIVSK
jgi:C4-type Zn-finger protein